MRQNYSTNFSVQKHLLLTLLLCLFCEPVVASSHFPPPPVPMKHFNEYPPEFIAPVLSKRLGERFAEYEKRTGIKIVVVVMESTDKFCDIQEYTTTLAEKWNLAQDREDDKSVLIVVASEDEASHITLGGALREIVPPETIECIRDRFIMQIGFFADRLHKMDQYRIQDGIDQATAALCDLLEGRKTPAEIHNPPITGIHVIAVIGGGIIGIMFIVIIWIIWSSRYDTHISAKDAMESYKTDFSDIYYWLEKEKKAEEEKKAQKEASQKDSEKKKIPQPPPSKDSTDDQEKERPTETQ